MKYDFKNENECALAINQINFLIANKRICELNEIKKTRSILQNSSLHQFLTMISAELNQMGLTFEYTGLKGLIIDCRYTPEIVKNFIWRPIQKILFNIESTKKINTQQINEISDVLIKFFGEKGIKLEFPSRQSLINQLDSEL